MWGKNSLEKKYIHSSKILTTSENLKIPERNGIKAQYIAIWYMSVNLWKGFDCPFECPSWRMLINRSSNCVSMTTRKLFRTCSLKPVPTLQPVEEKVYERKKVCQFFLQSRIRSYLLLWFEKKEENSKPYFRVFVFENGF